MILSYHGDAFVDLPTQFTSAGGSCGLNVFEADSCGFVVGIDRLTDVLVPMEDANLGNVARIVADDHGFTDIGRQKG